MKYFINSPYTTNSLRGEYRSLCKKLHPDTGGDAEKFNEMMNEYATVRLLIGKTNCRTEHSSFKSKPHGREDSGFSSEFKPHSREESVFNSKSKSSEESRYSTLYNLIIKYRHISESLEIFLKKISILPFKDVAVVYYKFAEEIRITMDFDKVIDELEIIRFSGYDEISYTIRYEQGSYRSCATIDAIIDKMLGIIKGN